MTLGSILIDMDVFEDELGTKPKFRIRMPAVPRKEETLTLPDAHYIVEAVYWHAHVPLVNPAPGYMYPDSTYYTIKIVVRQKYA